MTFTFKPGFLVNHSLQLFKILLTGMIVLSFQYSFAQNRTEEIPLWNRGTPDGPGPGGAEHISEKGSYTNISRPRLIVHRPQHPNGTAILVISGGGYAHIELGKESTPAADWLQSHGVTAFELVYRLPAEGWANTNVPLQDGQRAMRLIRSLSERFGLDPHRIGIMGFSAGGHLAGITATEPDQQLYAPEDHIDRLSARPDFAAMIYPVVTMLPPFDTTHAEKELIGKHADRSAQKAYSVQLHVNGQTPPTFLAQAMDDPISNVENSRLMYNALQKNNILSEIRIFPTGGHGWGMGNPDSPVHVWPEIFKAWAKKNGFWQ